MKKFVSILFAALLAVSLPFSAWAESNVKYVTLLASAARTSDTSGTAVSTVLRTNAINGAIAGLNRRMTVFINCTAASGSLDVQIEGSNDGGTTYFLLNSEQATASITATGKTVRRYEGPLPALVRATGDQGTAPAHTYSVTALLED